MKKSTVKNIIIVIIVLTVLCGLSELVGVIKETAVGKVVSEILTMKDGFDDDPDTSEIEGDERGYLPGETEDTINFQYSTDKAKNETVEPFDPAGYYESSNTSNEVYIESYENDLISSNLTENRYDIHVYDTVGNQEQCVTVKWVSEEGVYRSRDKSFNLYKAEDTESYDYMLMINGTTMFLNTYTSEYDRTLSNYQDIEGGYNGYCDYDGQTMFVSIGEYSKGYELQEEGKYLVTIYHLDNSEQQYIVQWDESAKMYVCNDRVYLCASDDPYYDYMIVDYGVGIYLEER